jgi:hypothetical protein
MKKKNSAQPKYVTIKRIVKTEENLVVKQILEPSLSISHLKEQLENGSFNLEQSDTVEPFIIVRALSGVAVAILEKEGGCGPDHKITIEVI